MTLYKWSQTAANNATADSSINLQEGQAPSSVNDSARAMMASVAKYRDDVSGAIVTNGTSIAYAVSSFETFDTLARLGGQTVAFTPHATNGATVTPNVDSLGAKPLRSSPGVELPAGSLILGTPYTCIYNPGDAAFYLHGGVGGANAYSLPLGAGIDYWGPIVPSSIFALAQGQAISRTTYATLFSLIGTTYGVGNGSTTFNIPDKVGRVSAMLDGGSVRLSSAYFSGNAANLGAVGGGESVALTAAQIPSITSANASVPVNVTSSTSVTQNAVYISYVNAGGGGTVVLNTLPTNSTLTSTGTANVSVTSNNTGGAAHRTVQPTIICNYIIRVL